MLFSSLLFLYLFLPITLLVYFIVKNHYKNYVLLLSSIIFFAWGGVTYSVILVISIIFNYFFGRLIQKHLPTKKARSWLIVGILFNLVLLGIFKYTNFIVENINHLFESFSLPLISETNILLPIGISFYTFHSLSYLIDIYRKKSPAQQNIFILALYICMFFQLVAGPIVRYSDVSAQLTKRKYQLENFAKGIERFLIGLAKKVLLANTFAQVADGIFSSDLNNLSALNAWLGIICYTLQIYLDFSAYSDMAIGLAKMFGFDFLENFNFPYTATSIKDFWRRWHISLSSFFRDYVYIPLGGSQVKTTRIYINLLLVFFLTGFWHGASWSFVVWGLFHGFFIVLERLGFETVLKKMWTPFSMLYTLLIVMFAWVLFRADTLEMGLNYWKALFNFKLNSSELYLFNKSTDLKFYLSLILALLGTFKVFHFLGEKIKLVELNSNRISTIFLYSYHLMSALFYVLILYLSTLHLIAGSYNPFIYYRF